MKASLHDFFEYNKTTNEDYIAQFVKMDEIDRPERAVKLFAHILNAHHIWLCRIRQQPPKYGVWEDHAISDFGKINEKNYQQTQTLLANESLDKVIGYQNSKGEEFENTVADILLHIVNHSTYHRAQIAHMFSANDFDIPNSDYIFHRRSLV